MKPPSLGTSLNVNGSIRTIEEFCYVIAEYGQIIRSANHRKGISDEQKLKELSEYRKMLGELYEMQRRFERKPDEPEEKPEEDTEVIIKDGKGVSAASPDPESLVGSPLFAKILNKEKTEDENCPSNQNQ